MSAPNVSKRRRWFTSLVAMAAVTMGAGIARGQEATRTASPQSQISEVLNKYPGLVEEFGRLLQRTLAEVKYPEGRTESRLLSVLPKSTIAYGAVSNYGDSTRQLLKIFHEELRDSEPLRKWWGSGEVGTSGPKVEAFLEKFVQFEEYLGNEAVFSGTMEGKEPKFFLLSEVRKPGLKEFLEKWTLELGEKGKPMGRVVDAQGLKGLKNVHSAPDPIWLVRPDYLLMGDDGEAMGALAARLDTKNRDFPATAFGQRVIKAYEGGATILAAADLQGILNTALAGDKAAQKILQDSGFENMKYAVWEHAGKAGEEVSKAELSFAGPRHGIASWLEKPTSLDSLDFSSPETILAISLVLKDPAKLYDEAKEMAAASNANTFAAVPMMEQSLKFSLRDDLLGELGGELTLEVDKLPPAVPAWRAILKVKDAAHLQKTLSSLLTSTHMEVKSEESDGVTTYSFIGPGGPNGMPISYAMVDGYWIIGSGAEAVKESVRMHRSGGSLAKSKKFAASLPPGRTRKASGMFYEDPVAVASLQFRRAMPSLAESLVNAKSGSEAATIWLYGDESAIREESASGPFDLGGVLVVAAIAIPNLLRSKIAANESSAVGSMRTVNTAQVTYSSIYQMRGFAPSLAALGPGPDGTTTETAEHAGLIDDTLGGASCTGNEWCTKSGYQFRMTSTCQQHKCKEYVVVATPVSNSTGTRNFCTTEDGVIRIKVGDPVLKPVTGAECRTWEGLQ